MSKTTAWLASERSKIKPRLTHHHKRRRQGGPWEDAIASTF
jgi:hypothetical protein